MKPRLERVRHPEILPLELSELQVNGGSLWEWSQEPDYPLAVRQSLQLLQEGNGVFAGNEPVPAVISGFEAAFLAGGRVEGQNLSDRCSGLAFPVLFPADPVCNGVLGGLDWLRSRGFSGWVLDLGNSQLKLALAGRYWIFPRDWTRLPPSGQVRPTQLPAQARRLAEFLAFGLQSALIETGQSPEVVLFALPARLEDDGTASASSYAGTEKNPRLLPEAMELGGLAQVPIFVLNDAELAALGALADPRLSAFRKVLVLTLGFGIGAALIRRAG